MPNSIFVVFFQKKLPPHMAADVEKWGGSLGFTVDENF
jgi:hypothetical protein